MSRSPLVLPGEPATLAGVGVPREFPAFSPLAFLLDNVVRFGYGEETGCIRVVALFHAAIDVAFTSDVASPVAVNIGGALVTVWGLAVALTWVARRETRPVSRQPGRRAEAILAPTPTLRRRP